MELVPKHGQKKGPFQTASRDKARPKKNGSTEKKRREGGAARGRARTRPERKSWWRTVGPIKGGEVGRGRGAKEGKEKKDAFCGEEGTKQKPEKPARRKGNVTKNFHH